jgi:hypothetical protein
LGISSLLEANKLSKPTEQMVIAAHTPRANIKRRITKLEAGLMVWDLRHAEKARMHRVEVNARIAELRREMENAE